MCLLSTSRNHRLDTDVTPPHTRLNATACHIKRPPVPPVVAREFVGVGFVISLPRSERSECRRSRRPKRCGDVHHCNDGASVRSSHGRRPSFMNPGSASGPKRSKTTKTEHFQPIFPQNEQKRARIGPCLLTPKPRDQSKWACDAITGEFLFVFDAGETENEGTLQQQRDVGF